MREVWIGNVMVQRVGFGPSYVSKILFIPLAAWRAAQLNRRQRFDALWAMMTYMLFPLVLAKLLGVRAPYVLSLQDGDSYEKVFKRPFIVPLTPVLDWGFRHASVIQAISSYLASWPQMRGSRARVEMIPNGASSESALSFSPEEVGALAQKIGKKENDIFILSIGRLVHQKGIDTVIRALPLLPAHVRLIVVGQGPDRLALEALAREMHVEGRVYFAGQVSRIETAKFRKLARAFVLPSRSEGQGISFLSTMLSGLPIVATQEGGIADFLFDAKRNPEKAPTGWAVDADAPEQIAAAVKDILEHPEAAQAAASNAQALAREKYDWDTLVRELKRRVFAPILQNI